MTSSTQPVVHFSSIENNKLSRWKHVGELCRTTGLAGEVTAFESPKRRGSVAVLLRGNTLQVFRALVGEAAELPGCESQADQALSAGYLISSNSVPHL